MRLRERLSQLDSALHARQARTHERLAPLVLEDRGARIARLRSLIADVVQREPHHALNAGTAHARGLRALPWGERRETPDGPLHVIERWLEPEHVHGKVRVAAALDVDAGVLGQLAFDPTLGALDLSRMLILDTETTGLSGGAGTVPFLIGLGSFEDAAFKLEQLLLPDLGGEAPLLHRLAERIASASCIVSYNGKAFDWPLLRTRFILHRIAVPALPPHLDLLHCARRVWKRRIGSLRLSEVERALLGFYREGDVEGAEIPSRYLGYLRGADPRGLWPVIEHNQHDVIALAAVIWRLCTHFTELQPEDDPRDHLSYARIALRMRDAVRAQAFADAVLAGSSDSELVHGACVIAAAVARLRGESEAAVEAWRRALESAANESTRAQAHLALARLYERKLKDIARAHAHARFTLLAEGPRAQGRRLGRLRRRMLEA